ncbi:hypothetical protein EDD11_002815 [Mortierella claussenii]|nr:hypothetical protein EDD11_002815 [Mortierella claussenii]
MGRQLHRSEGPACNMITGGCPTAPGPASIITNLTIAQSAPFAELMVSMQIISRSNQTIACLAVLLEQNMDQVNTAVSYLPLALALYSGSVSLVSIIMRAAVGSGFMSSVGTYGLAATSEMISVHTPGLFDVIFYTQFVVMTGQLSLNYPAFYSTFTSLFHWSFLEFGSSFAGRGPDNATYVLKYGGAGSVNQIKGPPYPGVTNDLGKRGLQEYLDWDSYQFPIISTLSAPMMEITPPPPTAAFRDSQRRKRQIQMTTDQVASTISPTSILPPTTSTTLKTTTATTTLELSPESSTTTSSSSKTKFRTTTISAQTTTSTTTSDIPTTSTTPPLIIPTITDPFDTKNWGTRQYNVSRFGIEAYAAAIGAFPSDLFLCTLVNIVMAGGNLLRIWTLFYTPLALSAMYQLTISGSTAMMAIASVALLVFSVGATVLFTWKILHASTQLLLFEDLNTLIKYGPLYNTLTEEGTLFFLVNLMARFLWGLTIAMLPTYSIAQVAILMLVELAYMLVIGIKWPFADSGDNKYHLLMGLVRIVIIGCSIVYLHDLNMSPEVRQLFGYIQMALHLAVFIVMFALILWNTIQVVLFWQTRHTASWRGPAAKNYSFEDSMTEADHEGWVLTGRPVSHHHRLSPHQQHMRLSHRPDAATLAAAAVMTDSHKSRRYTVQPYASVSDLGSLSQEDLMRHRSLYRHTHQPSTYRISRYPSEEDHVLALDARSEPRAPLAGSPEIMSARSISPLPHSPTADSMDGPAIPLQPTQLSPARFQAPPTESYARLQRMRQQQGTPGLRTRRMSEIFRDGGYLYEPNATALGSSSAVTLGGSHGGDKPSLLQSFKGTLGGLLSFGKRSLKKNHANDSSKPKAFEVMRPPRPAPLTRDSTVNEALSQASGPGGDNLRELNSVGISRFFQESGLNNDRNRSLFVANPEAMASQATSLRSSFSGMPDATRGHSGGAGSRPTSAGQLRRTISASTSVNTIVGGEGSRRPRPSHHISTDMMSILSGMGAVTAALSENDGGDGPNGMSESRRGSSQLQRQHSYATTRHSMESNIAEALRSETPLKLHGGAILKVSKGPEKAVQYWRKESGQYVGSIGSGDPASPFTPAIESRSVIGSPAAAAAAGSALVAGRRSPPPLLLVSNTPGFFDHLQSDVGSGSSYHRPSAQSIKSRAGSRPDSPTESYHSSNVAASAGRMHEILDRMFSDDGDDDDDDNDRRDNSRHDSDSDSDGGESCSTFSGRVSATILALQQRREQEESLTSSPFYFTDAQSMYRVPDMLLEPVYEQRRYQQQQRQQQHNDDHSEEDDSVRPGTRRAASISSRTRPGFSPTPGTLVRTFSGTTTTTSSGGSGGRLAGNSVLRPSKSGSLSRPLAQTPLHSPSVLPFSGMGSGSGSGSTTLLPLQPSSLQMQIPMQQSSIQPVREKPVASVQKEQEEKQTLEKRPSPTVVISTASPTESTHRAGVTSIMPTTAISSGAATTATASTPSVTTTVSETAEIPNDATLASAGSAASDAGLSTLP